LELALPPGGHYAESWRKFAAVKPVELDQTICAGRSGICPRWILRICTLRPPGERLAARMSVKWGDAAVKGAENQWRAIGLWQEQLEEHRPDPTPEITAGAQSSLPARPTSTRN
jgi:hypothetical protein